MKVQIETVSTVEKRFSIEVDPSIVEKELSQAYQVLSKQVKLPGFRPGKIPRRILEQKFRTEVESDVVRRVQLQAFVDAIKESKVPAVGDPQMSGGKIVPNQPFAFTARVEVKPEVTAKDYKGLALKKFETAIGDDKVQEQLDRMLQGRTTMEPVTDRDVVKLNDMVVIDFDATKDGKPFPGNTGRDVTVEVMAGELVEGNLPQLEGAKKGEPKKFDYTFPADYRVEEVKGQAAQFTVTVKEIKAKKVPPLDDAFAATLGMATVEELKARIRKDLERAQRNRASADAREDAFKKLAEKNPFEVPSALVERGVDIMLDAAFGNMQRSGVDPRTLNLDWGKLRDDLRPRSDTEVRGQLLLEAIAKQEQLAVTDEELEKKLEALAEDTGVPLASVRKQYKDQEARDSLKYRVLEDKALELVKSHAKYE